MKKIIKLFNRIIGNIPYGFFRGDYTTKESVKIGRGKSDWICSPKFKSIAKKNAKKASKAPIANMKRRAFMLLSPCRGEVKDAFCA